jgi:hypothetical protein
LLSDRLQQPTGQIITVDEGEALATFVTPKEPKDGTSVSDAPMFYVIPLME